MVADTSQNQPQPDANSKRKREQELNIIERSLTFARGAILSFGPQALKRHVWDKEYRENKWHFADDTKGDCVYAPLERHARGGTILDLGCGSGNTANEMAESAYSSYTGVDISEEALAKARRRSKENGREGKNSFACSDFLAYEPAGQFNVILFRESMYHVPLNKVTVLLDKYAQCLKEDGVFIVRLFAANRETSKIKHRPTAMFAIIAENFDVIERRQYAESGSPTVIVFRPRHYTGNRLINAGL
jgi:2-polyprenyl-3-methyl-5-hydroxy-6-metoxy-1,4-benzoquinol methylase